MGNTKRRTGCYFSFKYSVCQKDMWKLCAALLWCSLLLQAAAVTDSAAGLHVWSKHSPDVQAMLRKQQSHQSHQRYLSTPAVGVLYRRNGEHRVPSIAFSRSTPASIAIDSLYLNSLLKSAKNSENLPYIRRDYSSPWSTLYNSGNARTAVKYYQPTPSNLQGRTEYPSPHHVVKTDKFHHVNPARLSDEQQSSSISQHKVRNNSQSNAKDFYRRMYSTEAGVNYMKDEYGPTNLTQAKVNYQVDQELEDVRLANEHFLRMRNTIRCRVPAPEVVCVKDVHTETDKEYLPRCTLLHRCGDRSGCCDSDEFHCVPRAVQEVALNFYTVHLDYPPGEIPPENTVEKLLFENHTECECVSRIASTTQSPSRDQDDQIPKSLPHTTTQPPVADPTHNPHQRDGHHHEDEEKKKKFKKCGECPTPFHHREYEDGRCSCDCFDKERPCIRIKRGKEFLPEPERRCIEIGRCHIPDCEYGMFTTPTGRCPKRPDDYEKHPKSGRHHKNTLNEHHRWNFFERD